MELLNVLLNAAAIIQVYVLTPVSGIYTLFLNQSGSVCLEKLQYPRVSAAVAVENKSESDVSC